MMFEYMKKMNTSYDYVILTRLDIYFMKDFLNIDFTKLNLVSVLQDNNVCDDNFYLIPKKYIPLFDYFKQLGEGDGKCFRIIEGKFVTKDAGTGVVHCAPAFGEEDYKVCID